MQDIHKILLELLGTPERVAQWWATPNKEFEGAIPDDLWHSDLRGQVYLYITTNAKEDLAGL